MVKVKPMKKRAANTSWPLVNIIDFFSKLEINLIK